MVSLRSGLSVLLTTILPVLFEGSTLRDIFTVIFELPIPESLSIERNLFASVSSSTFQFPEQFTANAKLAGSAVNLVEGTSSRPNIYLAWDTSNVLVRHEASLVAMTMLPRLSLVI